MSDQFFIRLRGKIQGPFTSDQLQSLAKRGQFSRAHEVSNDGLAWSRATTRPELFPTSQSEYVPVPATPAGSPVPPEARAANQPSDAWYYHQMGAAQGPIEFNQLQYLVSSGQILPVDMVWKEGFPEWVQAMRIPGLVRADVVALPHEPQPSAGHGSGDSGSKVCPFCHEPIVPTAIKCKHCGSMLVPSPFIERGSPATPSAGMIHPPPSPNSPLLMALLSGCCIAGLGQIVLGQTTKGVMILLGSMVLGVVTAGVSIFVTWPLGGIDAYLVAKKLQRGQSVGSWECF